MTDRELLEMAAKAAGIELAWGGPDSDMARRTDTWNNWNPRDDDGDAMRLAVKLKIDVMHTNIHQPQVHALADLKIQEWENSSNDPYAATRRAIVRAAAAIRENMK